MAESCCSRRGGKFGLAVCCADIHDGTGGGVWGGFCAPASGEISRSAVKVAIGKRAVDKRTAWVIDAKCIREGGCGKAPVNSLGRVYRGAACVSVGHGQKRNQFHQDDIELPRLDWRRVHAAAVRAAGALRVEAFLAPSPGTKKRPHRWGHVSKRSRLVGCQERRWK